MNKGGLDLTVILGILALVDHTLTVTVPWPPTSGLLVSPPTRSPSSSP